VALSRRGRDIVPLSAMANPGVRYPPARLARYQRALGTDQTSVRDALS
jgi:hypothetical protein